MTKQLKKFPIIKSIWAVLATITLFFIGFCIWFVVNMQPPSKDTAQKSFTIVEGETSRTIAKNLRDQNFIKNDFVFLATLKLSGKNLMPGVHSLSSSFGVMRVVHSLQNTASDFKTVRVSSGMTLDELRQAFLEIGFADEEITAAFNADYSSPLLADKPQTASLEGYIFPDTYYIATTDRLAVLFEKAFAHLYEKLSADGSLDEIEKQGRTIYETLTLASIVQKEAYLPEDQEMIAGVFENRLNVGMNLGSDPTFNYAYAQGFCNQDTPSCDSVYNTRIHNGLPPSPIANMEYSAIQAVLYPSQHDYYFFFNDDDFVNRYSVTDAEHSWQVEQYCQKRCR